MEWQDQGTVLTSRRHGESSAILEIFTQAHGRHVGVVRGATSRKLAPTLQPGTQVAVTWRARLEEHLGSFGLEPIHSRAGLMSGRLELAALNAITGLLSFTLPEREPHPRLYDQTMALLQMISDTEAWPMAYLHWEIAMLDVMGFGMDLSSCAVTGATDDLIYVSPRTGRAVSKTGAGEWKSRLLPLPTCLQAPSAAPMADVTEALRTTGHFLQTWLAPSLGEKPLPPARQRLVDLLIRQSA